MKPKHSLPPSLKPKAFPTAPHVGVGWYTEDEWAKVKASARDPERFEATFQEWLSMANNAIEQLRRTGINAEKSFVSSSALLAWCLAHNKRNTAESRAEFVSQQQSRSQ
jgi:hypothetical protein